VNNLRWWIAGLLFVSSIINYIDRQVLSVLAPILTEEFKLSPTDYANIGLAFQIPYTLMYVGSGFLVDRWGARKALAIFMVWWSAASVLHAFARSAFSLGVFRFLLGLGEPGNFMAGFRAISEWYPPKEKGFVNGLLNGGAAVGAIIAPPLVAWLAIHFGWRNAFVLTGCAGFLWLVGWLLVYKSPPVPATVAAPSEKPAVSALLRMPETWALLLPRFVSDPVWWFYLLWLPKYLADQRGFTIGDIGRLAWMPYLAADLGALVGGLMTGWFIKRGISVVRARAFGMLPFAALMPLSVLVPRANTTTALAIICVVAFAHMAWKTNLQTVTNDIFPLSVVGTVAGIIAFGSGLGGSLFTWFTGWVVSTISYDAIFIIMGFLHPISFVIFRLLMKRSRLTSDFQG
jgi:ACS family hexuronate transporter-like MFS transporter